MGLKAAAPAPARPTWQSVIDALRAIGDNAQADWLEELRTAAKDTRVSTAELAKLIGKL